MNGFGQQDYGFASIKLRFIFLEEFCGVEHNEVLDIGVSVLLRTFAGTVTFNRSLPLLYFPYYITSDIPF
jgi:hypothetical protein